MDLAAIEKLPIPVLLRNTKLAGGNERSAVANLIAHLAAVDHHQAYRDAGFDSLHSYCRLEIGLPKEAANKRIRVARVVRRFPQVLAALEDGRLYLSGVLALAASLTAANVESLLEAASHKSHDEIEALVAELAPKLPMPSSLHPVAAQVSARTLGMTDPEPGNADGLDLQGSPLELSSRTVGDGTRGSNHPQRARVEPRGNDEWELRMRMTLEIYEELRGVQELLGHSPGDELEQLFLDSLRARRKEIEKHRYGATDKPRKARPSHSDRHIPNGVKRIVSERDVHQCTFISESGQRCPCKSRLEYDHIKPLARGGKSTVENLRLRCRAHNQLEAERLFGAGFMEAKRSRAKRSAETGLRAAARSASSPQNANRADRAETIATADVPIACVPPLAHPNDDLVPWLRKLGWPAGQATCIARGCPVTTAALEERVRHAIRSAGAILVGLPARAC